MIGVLPSVLQDAGAFIGLVLAISAVLAVAGRVFKKAVVTSLDDVISPVHSDIQAIKREVEVDSGKSLKDKVIRGFEEQGSRIDKLEGQVEIIRHIVTGHDD